VRTADRADRAVAGLMIKADVPPADQDEIASFFLSSN